MTHFDFEWFDRSIPPRTTRPRVGIQKRGTFSLNQAAYEGLGEPSHVRLAYDAGRQVIGIAAAGPDEPGAYELRKQPKSASFLFTGIAFAHRHGIPIGESRRYWGEMAGDVLVVDLNQDPDASSWPPKERDEFGRIPTAGNESTG